MIDEFEKYIDKRIEKAYRDLKLFENDEKRYLIYRNIIIELKTIKEYIKRRKER